MVSCVAPCALTMKMFIDPPKIYLHKQPVDFRKSINGLSLLVEQDMQQSPFSGALFVFCNRQRTRLKVLYWDSTGFCLWYKRLEKDTFRWPRLMPGKALTISEQQWHWLLQGIDIQKLTPHQPLHYQSVG